MPPSPRDEIDALWSRNEVDITFIVPCLNEAPRVTGAVESIRHVMDELSFTYELVVIDDGSTDGTSEVVNDYIHNNPEMPLRLFRNPVNQGLARTFVDGVFCAKGKYVRLMCGDNPEPRQATSTILRQIGKADIILPYNDRRNIKGRSLYRNMISRFYTWLVNTASGYSLHYYNGCPIVLRYHAVRWSPNNRGFSGFIADLVTHLLDEGASHLEVEVVMGHVTKQGRSPVTFLNCASTAHTLIDILSRRIGNSIHRFKNRKARQRAAEKGLNDSLEANSRSPGFAQRT